jgi:hypothetical protein
MFNKCIVASTISFRIFALALFLSHGLRDRDPSISGLARCRGNTVIYTMYGIAVTLYRL